MTLRRESASKAILDGMRKGYGGIARNLMPLAMHISKVSQYSDKQIEKHDAM
jgi:hypothetical protein